MPWASPAQFVVQLDRCDELGMRFEDRGCRAKVLKSGAIGGGLINLKKLTCYDDFIAELHQMFQFNGELQSYSKKWIVCYVDYEGGTMAMGRCLWNDFCNMVDMVCIYTSREETKEVNLGLPSQVLSCSAKKAQ